MAYRQNDPQRRNDMVRYDLIERIGVLNVKDSGWTREVNIVSWNDGEAKVDIREWAPDHKRMTKGITLFEGEAEKLTKLLARRYGLQTGERGFASRASFGEEKDRYRQREKVQTGSSANVSGWETPVRDDPQDSMAAETPHTGLHTETSDAEPVTDAVAACVAEVTDAIAGSVTETAAAGLA